MTKQEVISQIEAKIKPYAQVGMPQSSYWTTINRIKKGISSPNTEARFFKRFGYKLTKQAEYESETLKKD